MNGGEAVKTVGRIDRKLYSCVAPDILTDEVVITDERIAHVKERHPLDYERFYSYLSEIISNPDYIIEDKQPNTAIVLKTVEERGERFRLSLRLITSSDNPNYKNSILTFWKTHEEEWRRVIKNKKVLYRRE